MPALLPATPALLSRMPHPGHVHDFAGALGLTTSTSSWSTGIPGRPVSAPPYHFAATIPTGLSPQPGHQIFDALAPNGAGKTTAVQCVQGLRRSEVGARSRPRREPTRAVRAGRRPTPGHTATGQPQAPIGPVPADGPARLWDEQTAESRDTRYAPVQLAHFIGLAQYTAVLEHVFRLRFRTAPDVDRADAVVGKLPAPKYRSDSFHVP